MEAILEPLAVALPAIVVRHEAQIPCKTTPVETDVSICVVQIPKEKGVQFIEKGEQRSAGILCAALLHEYPSGFSGVDDEHVTGQEPCIHNMAYISASLSCPCRSYITHRICDPIPRTYFAGNRQIFDVDYR